jgi:PiT family inorganic phosphate transporter
MDSVMDSVNEGAWPNPSDLNWVVVVSGICMGCMAWGIGANDVANSFGTAFGAKCLTVGWAVAIAAVCELCGAVLLGGHVSDTIRKGMMSSSLYTGAEGRCLIMAGMTSVLLAAALWLLLASKYGLPVSTTHSAVGGVIAFAISSRGYGSVNWTKVGMIVASWFISPALSGVFAFILYVVIRHFVLRHEDSFRRAKIATPILIFLMTLIVALFTIYKGAKGIGLHKTDPAIAICSAIGVAVFAAAISVPFIQWWGRQLQAQDADAKKMPDQDATTEVGEVTVDVDAGTDAAATNNNDKPATENATNKVSDDKVSDTERIFRCFVVVIAGFQSLAHGANDVANSVGPFGAVLAASAGELEKKTEIPLWVFIVAGVCIVIGLAMYGRHVMATIGQNITPVTPSKAACAQWAATCVVLIATRTGIPVSTTHCAVGGVLGVGLADGVRAIDWKLMGKIFGSWILTLPLVGVAAAGTYAFFLPAVAPDSF